MSTELQTIDDAEYERLESEVNRFLDEYESAGGGLRSLLRQPRRTASAIRDAGRLPVLAVSPSTSVEGAAVRRELSRGHGRFRTPLHAVSGAITIPATVEEYESGSAKQTLRRKARSAQKRGVTWEVVTDADLQRQLVVLADEYERSNPRERYRSANPDSRDLLDYDLWLLARSADGAPLLLSVTPIDRGVGALRYFRTLGTDAAASDARYLMTRTLVDELAQRDVHYLVDTTISMHLSHGLRHFQRMVGFRLLRLEVSSSK